MARALELESQQDFLKKEVEILSRSNFDKVKEFHAKFNKVPDPLSPTVPTIEEKIFRIRLLCEEFQEVIQELGFKTEIILEPYHNTIIFPKLAKELADLLVVVYGTAAALGINIDDVFNEVHSSNMTKVDKDGNPVYREDGKVMKTDRYIEPDIRSVLVK